MEDLETHPGGIQIEPSYTPPTQFVLLAPGTIASDYALKNLNKSLGKAQVEFLPAVKGETNSYVGYKYTPLENIIGACRPALTKHHLTVSQFPVIDLELKTIALYTRLVHWDSGEWMQHTLELPADLALGKDGAMKFNQQTIGGSQTYAQKYAYKSILGIPDAEEMIDSSDEKGDTQARTKKPGPTPVSQVTKTTPAAAEKAAAKEPTPPAAPSKLEGNILTATVIKVNSGKTTQQKEFRSLTIADPIAVPGAKKPFDTIYCWHKSMWDDLNHMPDRECELMVAVSDKGITLNTILKIGATDWSEPAPPEDSPLPE
jgi:hypothetical protein